MLSSNRRPLPRYVGSTEFFSDILLYNTPTVRPNKGWEHGKTLGREPNGVTVVDRTVDVSCASTSPGKRYQTANCKSRPARCKKRTRRRHREGQGSVAIEHREEESLSEWVAFLVVFDKQRVDRPPMDSMESLWECNRKALAPAADSGHFTLHCEELRQDRNLHFLLSSNRVLFDLGTLLI